MTHGHMDTSAEGEKCEVTVTCDGNGCTEQRVCKPVIPHYKSGICPAIGPDPLCKSRCWTDDECSGIQKCCNTDCGSKCMEPRYRGKRNVLRALAKALFAIKMGRNKNLK